MFGNALDLKKGKITHGFGDEKEVVTCQKAQNLQVIYGTLRN
jgi:hypothetical protein